MSVPWGFFHDPEAIHLVVVLLCTIIYLAVCRPSSMNGLQRSLERDACSSYGYSSDVDLQDRLVDDVTSRFVSEKFKTQQVLQDICSDSHLFCFPSTLPSLLSGDQSSKPFILGFSDGESEPARPIELTEGRGNFSWFTDFGTFKLSSGRAISCSLNFKENVPKTHCFQTGSCKQNDGSYCRGHSVDRKIPSFRTNGKSEKTSSVFVDFSSLPHVEISPPLLDWGQSFLYFPSLAVLTIKNTHSDNILVIHEPYSTNSQFYPCDDGETLLGPGEVASVCFVFLPLWLGLSSAELILQTSNGGFLIQARGFGVESAYGLQPIIGMDASSSGRKSKNLSLFNPFDETLFVEEVTAWIYVISEKNCHSTEVTCSVSNIENVSELSLQNANEWLDVKSSLVDVAVMSLRLHRNWELAPQKNRNIIELDFSYHSKGKVFGAFCLKLLRSSKKMADTIVVPIEAELGGKSSAGDPTNPVSVSIEALMPCDTGGITVVALTLRNDAPYLLRVDKISGIGERTKLIHIKYMEGIILFPRTVTQVAVVTYVPLAIQSSDSTSEINNVFMDCKLGIVTNDTRNPRLEVPCNDLASVCARDHVDFSFGNVHPFKRQRCDTKRMGSLDSGLQSSSQGKLLDMKEAADELILENWKSHAVASDMSVLDDHEVLFAVVHVGSHQSKWITVKNPSPYPVVMQLILNSGEIIDNCRTACELMQPPLPTNLLAKKSTTPLRYGFSIAERALTEAYLHPLSTASFGPIFFHPSSRCRWRSSALVRNNLSGVEWLSLRGFGGSHSLVLFEGSEQVQNLEFKFNLPSSLNFSLPHTLNHMEDKADVCAQPLLKEINAKNMGDLPLEVRKIAVSGARCGLDGFVVNACEGFSLEPGESTMLLVSYQTDFSSATIQRDLELALATGILVIPMRAHVPIYTLNFCKKSLFWMRVKQFVFAILLVGSVMILIFCCILPHVMAFGSMFRSEKSSTATRRQIGNSTHFHVNQKSSGKLIVSPKLNGLLRSIEEENLISKPFDKSKEEQKILGPFGEHADDQGLAETAGQTNWGFSDEHVNMTSGCQKQTDYLSDKIMKHGSSHSNSVAAEGYDMQETSQSENFTVKTRKEKGRRRRRKRSSSTGITGILDISSSQSGNSTPSSPLSPITLFTPKRAYFQLPDADRSVEAGNALRVSGQLEKSSDTGPASVDNKVESSVRMKMGNNICSIPSQNNSASLGKLPIKPLLLPSAICPCADRLAPVPNLTSPGFEASASTVTPLARAPGSKFEHQTTFTSEKIEGMGDEFKYDIWGDHLFGLEISGRSNEISSMASHLRGSDSNSFFVRGPQTLVANSLLKSVSCHQEE